MEKESKTNYIKELIPYLIIIIVVILIRSFIITPIRVDGQSMYSTFDDGEILLLEKVDKKYKRFDVVVFKNDGERLIKRIIGFPGETIEYKNNKLYVNGKYIEEKFLTNNQETYDFDLKELEHKKIPKGHYFVLGDNRTNSTDSRILGPIKESKIQGKVVFTLFPFNKFGII